MVRLLFIHSTLQRAAEYGIHQNFAGSVEPSVVDSYFIWQDSTHDRSQRPAPHRGLSDRYFFYDFGRNLALEPKPSRTQRAKMMAQRVPSGLAHILKIARQIQPDFIYSSQQQLDTHYARIVSATLRIPRVMHVHYPIGPWLGRGIEHAIATAPHLFVASEFVRQSAIKVGAKPDRVHVQYENVPLKHYDIPRDRESVRAEFGIPMDAPIVTSAAWLIPIKHHDQLLRAFVKVRAQVPEARLLIFNTAPQPTEFEGELRKMAVDLGLGDRVIFGGHRPDVTKVYAGSDVYCLPSENEPFGLGFIESMAASLPVVACWSGAVPEIVKHEETGLLLQPNNEDMLANHLTRLLLDPATARRMGEAGRERVFKVFAPEVAAQNWVNKLESFKQLRGVAATARRKAA